MMGRAGGSDNAANFDWPRELAQRLLEEVSQRLAANPGGPRKALLEAGRDIFRGWIENARE